MFVLQEESESHFYHLLQNKSCREAAVHAGLFPTAPQWWQRFLSCRPSEKMNLSKEPSPLRIDYIFIFSAASLCDHLFIDQRRLFPKSLKLVFFPLFYVFLFDEEM